MAKKWYEVLDRQLESIMALHNLNEDVTDDIRNLMYEVALTQFMEGNKAGIEWMRRAENKIDVQAGHSAKKAAGGE